jgi:hypothetical protein
MCLKRSNPLAFGLHQNACHGQ